MNNNFHNQNNLPVGATLRKDNVDKPLTGEAFFMETFTCNCCGKQKERAGFYVQSSVKSRVKLPCKECYYQKYIKKTDPCHVKSWDGETWRDVVGWDGLYAISNIGRIKSLYRTVSNSIRKRAVYQEMLKTAYLANNGYYMVGFNRAEIKKTFLVHRLVAIAFLPNPENKKTVNHKNGIKTDNRVENLEWVTSSENNKHAFDTGLKFGNGGAKCPLTKYSEKLIMDIRASTKSHSQTARDYNMSVSNVMAIRKRITWKHI